MASEYLERFIARTAAQRAVRGPALMTVPPRPSGPPQEAIEQAIAIVSAWEAALAGLSPNQRDVVQAAIRRLRSAAERVKRVAEGSVR